MHVSNLLFYCYICTYHVALQSREKSICIFVIWPFGESLCFALFYLYFEVISRSVFCFQFLYDLWDYLSSSLGFDIIKKKSELAPLSVIRRIEQIGSQFDKLPGTRCVLCQNVSYLHAARRISLFRISSVQQWYRILIYLLVSLITLLVP